MTDLTNARDVIVDQDAELATLRARVEELERERDEARDFVLEFRGIVTAEMVDRALDAADYIPNADNRKWMRAALKAANVCESCASVAEHWSKRAEAAESRLSEATRLAVEALEPFAEAAQYHAAFGDERPVRADGDVHVKHLRRARAALDRLKAMKGESDG